MALARAALATPAAARVSIQLNEPVEVEPLDVRLLLEYGGGATDADHEPIPTVVSFAVGERTKTITVTATDDTVDDDGESVSIGFGTLPEGTEQALVVDFGTSCGHTVQVREGGESPGTANRQIEARLAEKAQRTPAQRKVSSQLLDARRAAGARRQAKGMDTADEMVMVDIRADVTSAVLVRIRALGGTVINSVARYRAIRARLPLAAVEKLATLDAIQSIRAADEAVTRDQPTGMPSGARTDAPDAAGTRTVNTSEGNVPD